jgi:hypothetical protein
MDANKKVKTIMTYHTKKLRLGLSSLVIGSAIVLGGSSVTAVMGQEAEPEAPVTKKRSYNSGRDPFKKYEPPKATAKRIPGQTAIPSLEDRITAYKAQKAAAMGARMPAPKPTTALLLSEIQVIGISRSPRGYAAIVEATPIKLSYVVYPGESFFDGQLVAIEDNRLVFRRETVFSDGRRTRNVETKPLRKPSAVNAMSTAPEVGPVDQSAAAAKP